MKKHVYFVSLLYIFIYFICIFICKYFLKYNQSTMNYQRDQKSEIEEPNPKKVNLLKTNLSNQNLGINLILKLKDIVLYLLWTMNSESGAIWVRIIKYIFILLKQKNVYKIFHKMIITCGQIVSKIKNNCYFKIVCNNIY